MAPMAGHRYAARNKMTVGYFAQHQMDDLPQAKTPYEHMLDLMPEATEAQRRARLGALGFGADKADTQGRETVGRREGAAAVRAGGVSRAASADPRRADQPSRRRRREALVHALNDYEGAVMLISHDRHLIEACADRLWIVRDGTVRTYDGDMESYRAECLGERSSSDGPRGRAKSNAGARPKPQDARRQAADRRAALAPLKSRVTTAETQIARLTRAIAAIDAKLADTDLYLGDAPRAQALMRERGELCRAQEAAEAAWISASEEYEAAETEAQAKEVAG